MWRWIALGALALVSLVLVTLGALDETDLGLGAAVFVAVLLMVEGIVRVTVFLRERRRSSNARDT
jgi:hypothetical protein